MKTLPDHRHCTVVTTPQWEEHICPPCPHGLEQGYGITLWADPAVNARQRALKLATLDATGCGSGWHDDLLARRDGADASRAGMGGGRDAQGG